MLVRPYCCNHAPRPVEIPSLSNRYSAREHWWGAPTLSAFSRDNSLLPSIYAARQYPPVRPPAHPPIHAQGKQLWTKRNRAAYFVEAKRRRAAGLPKMGKVLDTEGIPAWLVKPPKSAGTRGQPETTRQTGANAAADLAGKEQEPGASADAVQALAPSSALVSERRRMFTFFC